MMETQGSSGKNGHEVFLVVDAIEVGDMCIDVVCEVLISYLVQSGVIVRPAS